MDTWTVTLTKAHVHRGRQHAAGDRITVRAGEMEFLKKLQRIDPAKSVLNQPAAPNTASAADLPAETAPEQLKADARASKTKAAKA